jgi:hypothetical protein
MNRLLDVLALIGRYGTQGFVASIFLGLALPGFAATARPLLSACIFTFITLTFARADLSIIRRILRQPRRLAIACLWLIGAPALLIAAALTLAGRDSLDPGMVLGLAIIAAAPPILSGSAVAALLGIEPSLLLSATVITTVLAPAISPFWPIWSPARQCRSTARRSHCGLRSSLAARSPSRSSGAGRSARRSSSRGAAASMAPASSATSSSRSRPWTASPTRS